MACCNQHHVQSHRRYGKLINQEKCIFLLLILKKERSVLFVPFAYYHMKLAGGFRTLLTDRNKLIMTVGGATALAAGIYTTRYASLNYITYWI